MQVRNLHANALGLILLVAAFSAGGAANAADIYRPEPGGLKDEGAPVYVPANSWTGFYAGINGGYAWSNNGDAITYSGAGSFADRDRSAALKPQGGFGGGQIGYNVQRGSLVFGIESDIEGSDLSDGFRGVTANGLDVSSRERIDYFGTVRGRVGLAFGRTLAYATGGFAYGHVNERASLTNGINSVSLSNDGMQTGFTVGGGLEFKLSPAWSFKTEYQFVDLGSASLSGVDSTGAGVRTNDIDTSFHTVRAGLSYHLNAAPEPLK